MLSPMDIDTTINLVLRTDNEKNRNNEQLCSPLFASPCFLTSESNETPVIRNSRPEVLDSISELDRRQRERRENSEYQEAKLQDNVALNFSQCAVPRIEIDNDTETMVEPVQDTLNANRRKLLAPAPRLRRRPQVSVPENDLETAEKVIIPAVNEKTQDLGCLFQSPDSDRLVLFCPDLIVVPGTQEPLPAHEKKVTFEREMDSLGHPSVEGFNLDEIPSPTSTCGSESSIPGQRTCSKKKLQPKRPRRPSCSVDSVAPEQVIKETEDLLISPYSSGLGLASTPARHQFHDQGAPRFGTMRFGWGTSSGSTVLDASPSNLSESNFRTPIKEPTPRRHSCNSQGEHDVSSVGLIIPNLYTNSEDPFEDELELSHFPSFIQQSSFD